MVNIRASVLILFDLFRLRKQEYIIVVVPVVLLGIFLFSSISISNNFGPSLQPSTITYNDEFPSSSVDFSFQGPLGSAYWQAYQNQLQTISNTLNQSLIDSGVGLQSIDTLGISCWMSIDFTTVDGSGLYTVPDYVFQDIISATHLNIAPSLIGNNTLAIIEDNTSLNYLNSPLTVKTTNITLLPVASLSLSKLNKAFPYSSFILNDYPSSGFLLITTTHTFFTIAKNINNPQPYLNGFVALNSTSRYNLLYNLRYRGVLNHFSTVLSDDFYASGISIQIFNNNNLFYSMNAFYNQVDSITLIWIVINIPVLLFLLLIVFVSVKDTFERFKKETILLRLKGTASTTILEYFSIEIVLITSIGFFIGKGLAYCLDLFIPTIDVPQNQLISNFLNYLLDSSSFLLFLPLLFLLTLIYSLHIQKFWNNKIENPLYSISTVYKSVNRSKFRLYLLVFLLLVSGTGSLLIVNYILQPTITRQIDVIIKVIFAVYRNLALGSVLLLLIIESFKICYSFFYQYGIKNNLRIFGIQTRVFKLIQAQTLSRIRLLFIITVIFITLFTFMQSYQTNLYQNSVFIQGAPVTVETNTSYNQTLETALRNFNAGTGTTTVAEAFDTNLGSSNTVLPQTFNILGIDPTTFSTVTSLDIGRYGLSESMNTLFSALKVNNTIIAQKGFLAIRGLKVGNNISVLTTTKNNNQLLLTFHIIGSYTLWPGFLSVTNSTDFNNNAFITSLNTITSLANIYNKTTFYTFYRYLLSPASNFNVDKFVKTFSSNNLFISLAITPDTTRFFANLIYTPLKVLLIYIFLLVIVKSFYDSNNYYKSSTRNYSILRCFGFTQNDLRNQFLYQQPIYLLILIVGIVFGIMSGFFIVNNLFLPNVYLPLIFSTDPISLISISLPLYGILLFESFITYKKFQHDHIAEKVSIED